jgi:multidrug efflux system outer membrane protein
MKRTVLAVALALTGCAVGGSKLAYTPELPGLAAPRSATVQAVSMDRLWTLFADAHLQRLIDEALLHNADLEAAVARVREAQATLGVVRAAQMPTLDAKASSSRQQQAEMPGFDRRFSTHRLSLEAGYEADLWGKLSASTAAARYQLLATEWARAAFEWSLSAAVAEGYFELAAVDRQLEISHAVRASRENAALIRGKEYAAGAGSEFDLRRAQAELAATDSTIASLGRTRAALEFTLNLLTGRDPHEIATGRFAALALDEGKTLRAIVPHGEAADLLVRRPDVRQAEAQLAAANASIDAARAATLPTLRLTGAVGSDSRSISDLFSGPAAIWSLGAALAQPIFDGGRLRARVQEEEARAAQSLSNYRKVIATAVADVREAYANLDLTTQAFDAERNRVASLARAHDLARRGHAAGALAYLDLLDAERNLYQAQLQQVGAYRDQLISQVSAFKALGDGYVNPGSPS